jgi:hypothetical protein
VAGEAVGSYRHRLRTDVFTQPSPIRWASRWDTYLSASNDEVHWFSIINSLVIVLFLSGMVAMIMMRTLHRDISAYNQLETAEEAQEETGWKLVPLPSWPVSELGQHIAWEWIDQEDRGDGQTIALK